LKVNKKHKTIAQVKLRINLNNANERAELLVRCCELLLIDKLDCLHELRTTLRDVSIDHLFKIFSIYSIPADIRHENEIMKMLIICPELHGNADFYIQNPSLIRNNPEVDGNNSSDHKTIQAKTIREKSMEQETTEDLF
jgi:hypothetical protein